jgi:hypothetical protein
MDRSSTSAAAASTSRGRIFHIFSTKNIHVGSTLKFVYTNPASFGASHMRKQPVDHVSSPKAAVKKRKLSGIPLDSDKVINRQKVKESISSKKERLRVPFFFFVRDCPKKYSFMYTIHHSPSCNNIACIFESSTCLVCGNTAHCFEERQRWVIVLMKLMCMTTDVCFDYEQ